YLGFFHGRAPRSGKVTPDTKDQFIRHCAADRGQSFKLGHGDRLEIYHALTVRLRVRRGDAHGTLLKINVLPAHFEQFAAPATAIKRCQYKWVDMATVFILTGFEQIALFIGRKDALTPDLLRHSDKPFTL